MDRIDKKILTILQNDCTISVADLAKKVGLSTTPCWRRIQKLEEDKVITKRVALLDPKAINTAVTVFVSVKTGQHNSKWLEKFSQVVSKHEEVVEFYRMSGQVDYLLKVVVPDIDAYDRFYRKLVSQIDIEDISSVFAMEAIKQTTQMPLDYLETTEAKQG